MENLKQKFGCNVRKFRKAKKFTQVRLAGETGVTEETISNIERGIAGTQFSLMLKLANALGAEVWQLFYFED